MFHINGITVLQFMCPQCHTTTLSQWGSQWLWPSNSRVHPRSTDTASGVLRYSVQLMLLTWDKISHLLTKTLLTMNTKREKQRERSVNRPMIPDSTLWHKHNVSRHGFNCGRKYMTEKSASTCCKETRTPLSLVFIFILFIVYNFCGCLFIILNPFGKL